MILTPPSLTVFSAPFVVAGFSFPEVITASLVSVKAVNASLLDLGMSSWIIACFKDVDVVVAF